jgi:hypothetical protein
MTRTKTKAPFRCWTDRAARKGTPDSVMHHRNDVALHSTCAASGFEDKLR